MASDRAESTTELSPVRPSRRRRRRPGPPPARTRARRRRPSEEPPEEASGAIEVAAPPVPAWEWTIAVVALFAMGRSPVLFYRERVGELFDADRAFYIWQDDGIVRAVLATVLGVLFVIAARRCPARTMLRQPLLLAFVLMTFASITWSIEPTASMWRVMLFTGTTVAGWYLGERYEIRQLVSLVGAAGAVAALTSLIALAVWPSVASVTNRVDGLWSGAYVNRNLLGLAMGIGLLSLPFLWADLPRRRRPLLLAAAALEAFLLQKTGSRTPVVGLAAAASVGVPLVLVRRATTRALRPSGGAVAVGLVAGYLGLLVHWNWSTILSWLGRRWHLTRRTVMWAIDRYYADMHPWKGWGFEAIWAHPPTIGVAQSVYGRFPYSAHSGYYEVLLGVGRIGLAIFVAFLVLAGWRAFRFAWDAYDPAAIWPLCFLVFSAVVNVSESLFVSGEATWALTVAAAVVATEARGRRRTVS